MIPDSRSLNDASGTPPGGEGHRRPPWRRGAVVALMVVFLGLVRTLAEVHRLRLVRGDALTLGEVLHFVNGGIIAAAGAWIAVVLFVVGRYRLVVAMVAATVAAMLAYKFLAM